MVTKISAIASTPKSAGVSSRDSTARISSETTAWTTAESPAHRSPARVRPVRLAPAGPPPIGGASAIPRPAPTPDPP